jgi:hypothetical protein
MNPKRYSKRYTVRCSKYYTGAIRADLSLCLTGTGAEPAVGDAR